MKYNTLGKSGIQVSEIGMGCEYLEGKDYSVVDSTIGAAMDAGINIFDCFMSEPNVRSNIGRALKGRRDKALIQGHFRSVWKNGQYTRTHDMKETEFFFNDLLTRLDTDYIDIGMIHLVDNEADFDRIFNGPLIEYVQKCKQQGTIRLIGMSSHNAAIALKAVKTGLLDVLLFSVNPAYDMLTSADARPRSLSADFFDSKDVQGIDPERAELFKTCEANGVGITVMKVFAAGALLNEKTCPFGRAFTPQQCIHYALTRPAVSSVLAGMQSPEEVAENLRYETMRFEEKDYSPILALQPKFSLEGQCVYCNHCLPCTMNINIAAVNKYLDLAQIQGQASPTLREHYNSLENKASSCIQCGQCEANCPFSVQIMERMERAAKLFE